MKCSNVLNASWKFGVRIFSLALVLACTSAIQAATIADGGVVEGVGQSASSDYGSDGFVFWGTDTNPNVNAGAGGVAVSTGRISSLPSYVTSVTEGAGRTAATSFGYLIIDNPLAGPATIESGLLLITPVGTEEEYVTITLGAGIPAAGFSLDILADNSDGNGAVDGNLNNDIIRVTSSTGSDVGVVPAASADDLDGDVYRFSITGASSGDTLTIYGQRTGRPATIGGVMFTPVPEPSSIFLALLGVVGLFIAGRSRCRKDN